VAQFAKLVRTHRGSLRATRLGKDLLTEDRQRALQAILFHLTFWACRSRLSRPRRARFMAATRYRHPALVALRSGDGLANAREADPRLRDPGNRNTASKLGHGITHDGSMYPEAAALVWPPRTPGRKSARLALRRAAFLSQGAPVRSLPHLRCPHRTAKDSTTLSMHGPPLPRKQTSCIAA
jgi:hypothetical protein